MSELERLLPSCPHRLGPLVKALCNQRDTLLAFASELDQSLSAISDEHDVSEAIVRALLLASEPRTPSDWQAEAVLRKRLGSKFYELHQAVMKVTSNTVRASSGVENLNSRLRHDFFLRRHLSNDYLELLRFCLDHHRFPRSERPERVGCSPHELLTGERESHWLDDMTSACPLPARVTLRECNSPSSTAPPACAPAAIRSPDLNHALFLPSGLPLSESNRAQQ